SPDPGDHKTHPAIIWITGGDSNTIGDVWSSRPISNDQTASAFRQAGILMMFPSLRGGNTNPGYEEKFYGEVNDVVSAADFLASQPYVDTSRIYLGGHSTGGTLVLLVAQYAHRFRATFSFGPVADPTTYGPDFVLPFNRDDSKEVALRSPGKWLASIVSPTFVIEGEQSPSNLGPLTQMMQKSKSSAAHFLTVPGLSHFSVLAPVTKILAKKILQDQGETCNIKISPAELAHLAP
ncbi:MAG TPA: prolyl oligopeptidase family serine peptidase, partial [Phycisphaerae bacterium]